MPRVQFPPTNRTLTKCGKLTWQHWLARCPVNLMAGLLAG